MEQEKVSLYIDDEVVDQAKLITAYRFWKKYHIKGGELDCPLCGSDLSDNELFVCECCHEILPTEDRCWEHYDNHVCNSCCELCQDQKNYEDAVNSKIDSMRGK